MRIIELPTEANVSLTPEEREELKFDLTEEKVVQAPDWLKNNAKWWHEGLISDDEFINAIKFLIEKETITLDREQLSAVKKWQYE